MYACERHIVDFREVKQDYNPPESEETVVLAAFFFLDEAFGGSIGFELSCNYMKEDIFLYK